MDLGLQAIESGDDGGNVAEEGGIIEARVELAEAQLLGDRRIDGEKLPQRATLVGGTQGGSLDDSVGLLA
jgi:hypothetical protein